jgi:hypothetical protein
MRKSHEGQNLAKPFRFLKAYNFHESQFKEAKFGQEVALDSMRDSMQKNMQKIPNYGSKADEGPFFHLNLVLQSLGAYYESIMKLF